MKIAWIWIWPSYGIQNVLVSINWAKASELFKDEVNVYSSLQTMEQTWVNVEQDCFVLINRLAKLEKRKASFPETARLKMG